MGARPEDYARAAPYKSYIHVDQFSGPRDLAEFLLELDKDDQKYNQYFQVILVLYCKVEYVQKTSMNLEHELWELGWQFGGWPCSPTPFKVWATQSVFLAALCILLFIVQLPGTSWAPATKNITVRI